MPRPRQPGFFHCSNMSLVDLVGINTCWVHRSARIPDTSRQDGISLLVSGFSRTWSKKGSKLTGSTRPADSVGITALHV